MAEGAEKPAKNSADWKIIERDYRAGIKTLRQIAGEHGITHGAVNKRAKVEGWTRDLQPRIQAAAQDKVSRALVSNPVSKEAKATERQVVEANANVLADVDLTQRSDVKLAIDVSRSQLVELAALSDPAFAERLEWLGEQMDQTRIGPMGNEIKDKANELYRYIISLAGRVKMSKEIAGSHGVYIPIQRKIYKLDDEADKSLAEVDLLLKKINDGSA